MTVFATRLGGLDARRGASPTEAADRAAAVPGLRIEQPEEAFSAVAAEPGGLRSLALLAVPIPPIPAAPETDLPAEAAS